MATLKKSARKKTASASKNEDLQAQAEQMSKRLRESLAQQVWLAGVGAFGRAQAEGTKLFETLVKEGLSLEHVTRKAAGGKAQAMRDAVETTVGQARERASDTWVPPGKGVRGARAPRLRRLKVPRREDLSTLIDRVDALNAELRKLGGVPPAKTARTARPRKAANAKKPAPAAKKTPAKRASLKKAAP